jgi:hypothetical protein
MADQDKRNPALRHLGLIAGAVALWCVTEAIAFGALRHHQHSTAVRVGLVVLGVAGFIPWQLTVAKTIRLQDEFTRRIHLVSLAIAFGVTNLLVFSANLLQYAGFINEVPLMVIWFGMWMVWWVALLVTARYYR